MKSSIDATRAHTTERGPPAELIDLLEKAARIAEDQRLTAVQNCIELAIHLTQREPNK